MSKSTKVLHDEIRARYMSLVRDVLLASGEEVLTTNSNEFAIPTLDGEGNEEYIVLTFKIPKGSRDGDPYDGYEVAADYTRKCVEREEKAKAAAERKAKKIAKDEALRAAKAKAKAEREAAEKV